MDAPGSSGMAMEGATTATSQRGPKRALASCSSASSSVSTVGVSGKHATPQEIVGLPGSAGLPEVDCQCKKTHCVFCITTPPRYLQFSRCKCNVPSCVFNNWGIAHHRFPDWAAARIDAVAQARKAKRSRLRESPDKKGQTATCTIGTGMETNSGSEKTAIPHDKSLKLSKKQDTCAPHFWRCSCKKHVQAKPQFGDRVLIPKRITTEIKPGSLFDFPAEPPHNRGGGRGGNQHRGHSNRGGWNRDKPGPSSRTSDPVDLTSTIINAIKELKHGSSKKKHKKHRRRSPSSSSSSSSSSTSRSSSSVSKRHKSKNNKKSKE